MWPLGKDGLQSARKAYMLSHRLECFEHCGHWSFAFVCDLIVALHLVLAGDVRTGVGFLR